MCLGVGRTEVATVVDHKVPHKGDAGLMWDQGNWQSLCATHHNEKTSTLDGGFGNRNGSHGTARG
jgi:5-methylcytosine-specific restriction enzyme A